MKKAYYLLFYKLYRFWKTVSDDNWSDWKAYVVIGGAEVLLLLEVYVWGDVIFRDKNINFSNPYQIGIPLSLFITILNYYIFLHNDRWKNYEVEFKNYSKQKSKLLGWLVFLFLIGVLGSLIFAFYQMSLIDWSKYR